jgi:cellulose synthase/poly-beta-1,6-N-acetylglucosamine synthase-like glycosyltransferase
MNAFIWNIRTSDSFVLATVVILAFFGSFLLFQNNIILVLLFFRKFVKILIKKSDTHELGLTMRCPNGLIIIPSLLRNLDDYIAITSSVDSCATNGYPGQLVIITSIDGRYENHALYEQLVKWVGDRNYGDAIQCYVSYRDVRGGKMMAIETGVDHMKELVASGIYPSFPEIYFSIDADTTLGDHALEHLVAKLLKRHPITGDYRKGVSGKPCTHPSEIWQGWRKFFTMSGQIYINVARQYLTANLGRYNWEAVARVNLPGALYCTWSDVILQAPRYMGYLESLRFLDWIKWWFGFPPIKFSESDPTPLPEALTGNTDDTSIAILVIVSTWKNGKLTFDFPTSPMKAFIRMLRELFVERSLGYAPEARAFTFTPPNFKGLWLQRVRWNSCRIECGQRFWRTFQYNWQAGFPYLFQLLNILLFVGGVVLCYVILPFNGENVVVCVFVIGYSLRLLMNISRVFVALSLEEERVKSGFWRTAYCLPVAIWFDFIFGFAACFWGIVKDILWQGTNTRFVPENTLIAGKSQRIAIFFRLKRFISLCLTSVRRGNIPFGSWWFGWHAHAPYVDSGFKGWTSGKKSSYNLK